MSKNITVLFAAALLIVAAIALFPVRHKIPGYSRIRSLFRKEQPKVEEVKPTGIPEGYTFKHLRRSDKIDLHRQAAAEFGLPIINTKEQLEQDMESGELVPVIENKGYKIHTLTHSHPALIPEAYEALREIGVQFWNHAGPDNVFVVTSLTRTADDQKRLRRVNSNATRNESTHCYGCSFDISYVRFNEVKEPNQKLQKILEDILVRMKDEGRLYVIIEKKSACYHLTVRKAKQ